MARGGSIAVQNFFGGCGTGFFAHESDNGSAESASGETGSFDARDGEGDFDEKIQLGGAVFEEAAGAVVGGRHETSEGREVMACESFAARTDAFVFAGDMKAPAFSRWPTAGAFHLSYHSHEPQRFWRQC